MAGRFELKQAKDSQYMFNLKAGNGQIILTSELYKTKVAAENGIESVRKMRRMTDATSARKIKRRTVFQTQSRQWPRDRTQ